MKTLMIDIDNTLAATIECVVCDRDNNDRFIGLNRYPRYKEIVNPDLFSLFGCDIDYVWEKALSTEHRFITPVYEAVTAFNKIVKSGKYNIIINTARNYEWKEAAMDWLNYYGVNISDDNVIFTASGSKYGDFDDANTIIIEDNIMELKKVKEAQCLLFNRPWSKTYGLSKNINVISSWSDVLIFLEV